MQKTSFATLFQLFSGWGDGYLVGGQPAEPAVRVPYEVGLPTVHAKGSVGANQGERPGVLPESVLGSLARVLGRGKDDKNSWASLYDYYIISRCDLHVLFPH